MKRFLQLLCLTLCNSSFAEVHIIAAEDFTFVPDVIHVIIGDTVRWEYSSGTPHTVTSGTNCSWDGYFHEALSSFDPVVKWVVPEDAPSEFYYFCAPHCIQGMTGIVNIATPCIGDTTNDNEVNVADLLVIIDAWGSTNSTADVNEDGIVDVSDLLIVVGNWGPCE